MNWLDLIILILLIGGLISGYKNGLIGELASLAALVFGIWGSIKFSGWTANLLATWGIESQYMNIISFVVTFIIIVVVIQLVAKMLSQLLKSLALGWLNRITGIGVGLIKTALFISIILFVIDIIDDRKNFIPSDVKENSLLYQPMANFIPYILPFFNLEDFRKELDDRPGDTDTVIS